MQKLGNLVSEITATHSYKEVAEVLARLKDSGTTVEIKFQGDSRSYSSSISAFNSKHKVFVLDNMNPPVPSSTFRKGRTVTVSTGNNGQSIELESKYLEPLLANQDRGYQMKVAGRLHVVESEPEFDSMLSRLSSANSSIHGAKNANYADL